MNLNSRNGEINLSPQMAAKDRLVALAVRHSCELFSISIRPHKFRYILPTFLKHLLKAIPKLFR